jgi:hypothetical protein
MVRVNGVATQLNNAHFLPTAEQQQTLNEAATELTREEPRVQTLLARVNAALRE